MLQDGVQLLDGSKIEERRSDEVGTDFPSNPAEGQFWEKVGEDGKSKLYIYSKGSWVRVGNPYLKYHDVSFSVDGSMPDDYCITRYAISKACMLDADFDDSVAVMVNVGLAETSSFEIKVDQAGSITKVGEIHFNESRNGTFVSEITEDFMLVHGDVLEIHSKTVGAESKDLCVTLSTYLV